MFKKLPTSKSGFVAETPWLVEPLPLGDLKKDLSLVPCKLRQQVCFKASFSQFLNPSKVP